MGAPLLEGSQVREPEKVHSDLLSSSLSCQSAPLLEPGPNRGCHAQQEGAGGPSPLSVDESCVYFL